MSPHFFRNVLLKGLLLFIAANLLLAALNPTGLGKLSLYNHLFPGRERLPFGENSAKSYNLSLYDLDAMFASHEISAGPKPAGQFRVVTIGDSSVWGTLLRPEQTLAGQLNALGLSCGGKTVRVYNLGYPTISVTKDVMLMQRVLAYQPDLILWPTTLEAFPRDKQLSSPLVANNVPALRSAAQASGLKIDPNDPALVHPTFWDQTIIGQRRALSDLFRLQMLGILWGATGIDQEYPEKFQPAQVDFQADDTFHGLKPPAFPADYLAFDALEAGLNLAQSANVPVLLVNEPMLLSPGKNSQIRYNFYYPRWAYDAWHAQLLQAAKTHGWNLLDLWDAIPASEFTNSAIHLTPVGEEMIARQVGQAVGKMISCTGK